MSLFADYEPRRGPAVPVDGLLVRPATDADGPALVGVHVLFVDDNPDTRQIVASHLQRQGAHVHMAPSEREALHFLEIARPHVIVCDIAMPGMSGMEFIRRARALPTQAERPTPAIAYAAFPDLRDATLAAGFQDHVVKEVGLRALTEAVARLAAMAQLLPRARR